MSTPIALDKKPVSGGGGYPQFLIISIAKNKEGFGCQRTLNFLFIFEFAIFSQAPNNLPSPGLEPGSLG